MTTFEQRLNELLEKDFGIPAEQITPEFIRNWREEHEDELEYDITSQMGGLSNLGLRMIYGRELKEMKANAKEFMAQFRDPA
jgi:hypothetical protein